MATLTYDWPCTLCDTRIPVACDPTDLGPTSTGHGVRIGLTVTDEGRTALADHMQNIHHVDPNSNLTDMSAQPDSTDVTS
jgi:hypothetical protein